MGAAYFSPTDSGVDSKSGAHAPIVREITVVRGFAKVFNRRCRTRSKLVSGNAQQKIGKVGSSAHDGCSVRDRLRGRAGEIEGAARVLLGQIVELLAAKISTKRKIVARANPQNSVRNRASLIVIERRLGVGERCDSARKRERRWAPIDRVLIVPRDPRIAADVFALIKKRRGAQRETAELESQCAVKARREGVPPIEVRIDPKRVGRIEEAKGIGVVRTFLCSETRKIPFSWSFLP